MDSLFWSIATSHFALLAIAGMLLAALVVGYVPLLKFVPVIGPYVRVAKLVAFLTFGLLCALLDRRSADMRAEINQLRTDLTFADVQLNNLRQTADDKARLAGELHSRVSEISAKVADYESRLASVPENPDCPDRVTRDEQRELRAITERVPKQSKLSAWQRVRGLGGKRRSP